MKKMHLEIYDKAKAILKEYFDEDIKEYDKGRYITIGKSGIWMSSDNQELTIGFGFIHNHYNPDFDDINNGIELLYNLLAKRKRITSFYKGGSPYKYKVEIELDKEHYKEIGTSGTWFSPFWKATITKITFEERLIDSLEFENSILKIKVPGV